MSVVTAQPHLRPDFYLATHEYHTTQSRVVS
jgi:hypothetical protein